MPDDLDDDHRDEQSPEQAPDPQPSGRDRLRRALLRPSRSQLVVAVLLALVGYASITQVRFNEVDNTYGSLREQDLIDVLNGLAGTTQRAEAEIARLQRTRDDLQSSTGAREAALAQAQKDAETLAIMAGLVPVTGPGIRVTITESDTAVDADTMVDMIQELRTAGAEAIQINGEVRVVASTSFADGVGGIMVGDQLVTSPYVVDVIGEPHTLADSGMDFPKGPRDQFEEDDATVEVDELASIDIGSVVEPERPEYALPDPSQ
jgi:uncharacterized protein YlxW (UPF0749 family)